MKSLMEKDSKKLNADILIVEDDKQLCQELVEILSEDGYRIECTGNIALAREELQKRFYNIALVDLKLPDGSGLDLLKEMKQINVDTRVIIFTGYASLESSIFALDQGAVAYIPKPFNIDKIRESMQRAITIQQISTNTRFLIAQLKELSMKDTHTELYNYRYLMERLALELKRAKRNMASVSVIMLDIDYFKSINDIYGHDYGDIILKEFARYLKSFARGSDTVARYGGEEFVIILSDTSREGAIMLGKRLLEAIRSHMFDPYGKRIRLHVSMGVSSYPEDGPESGIVSGLIKLGDEALLSAKETGRDRVSTAKGARQTIEEIVNEQGREKTVKLSKKIAEMAKRSTETFIESIYSVTRKVGISSHRGIKEYAEKVSFLAVDIGKKLSFSQVDLENLRYAAILYDIGKISIPANILYKKRKLTEREFVIMKKHPQIAVQMIGTVSFLKDIFPLILFHHERFDGTGYVAGLKGREIPLGARIIAAVDAYQALISDRPYRKAYSKERALEIIGEGCGRQFDPRIVELFFETVK